MKLIYNILIALTIPASLLLMSYAGGSPGGKSGSMGDNLKTCTDCHSGVAQPKSGWITTNIPATGYEPGQTYTITATGTHTGVVKMGFEMTAENTSGSKVGSFSITNASRTKFTNNNSAVTHTSGGITPNNNSNSWSADWTAPAAGSGQVNFNAAFNAANGNGNTSGDQIYTTVISLDEFVLNPQLTSIDPDAGQQGWNFPVTIAATDTEWKNGVTSVSFVLHSNPTISFNADGFTVNTDTQITANLSIAFDQEVGIYDLWVDDLVLENAFTVDILDALGEDILANKVSLYPNPAVSLLSVEAPVGSEMKVFNLMGQQMQSLTSSGLKEQLDVSSFDPGVYVLRVVRDGELASYRFVKN